MIKLHNGTYLRLPDILIINARQKGWVKRDIWCPTSPGSPLLFGGRHAGPPFWALGGDPTPPPPCERLWKNWYGSKHFLTEPSYELKVTFIARYPGTYLAARGTHHDEVSADFSQFRDIFRSPPSPVPVQPPVICSSRSQAKNFITLQPLTDLSQRTDAD